MAYPLVVKTMPSYAEPKLEKNIKKEIEGVKAQVKDGNYQKLAQ